MFAFPNGIMLGLWSKYTAEPRVDQKTGATEVCFATENVDSLYDFLANKKLTVIQKPTAMDFGKTFVVLDPDGHRVRFYRLAEK